jgi:hypothetical protein
MATSPRLTPPAPRAEDPLAQSVLAHQPELQRAFLRLYATLWQDGIVDPVTKEIARLRSARRTDCRY